MALKFKIKPGDYIIFPHGSYKHPGPWKYLILSVEIDGRFQYEVLNGPPRVVDLRVQDMHEDWIPGEVISVRNILAKYDT